MCTAQAVRDGEAVGALLDMAENVCLKKNEALTNVHERIHSGIAPCPEDRSENLRDTVQEDTGYSGAPDGRGLEDTYKYSSWLMRLLRRRKSLRR